MYIKMNSDKSLIVTVSTTLYRGEKNADLITFLIPAEYEGKNVADCSIVMRYVLPNGIGRSDALVYQPEMYKGYLQYSTPANTRLTSEEGVITIWLTGFDMDDNVLFKTGEVPVTISPSKDIADYLPQEDLDQMDQLAAQVADLERRKADSITFHVEDNTLQLLANHSEIGDRVEIPVGGDDAVYVPSIDEHKVLSWSIQEQAGEIPDPVDLNPNDEWSSVDDTALSSDYVWEDM